MTETKDLKRKDLLNNPLNVKGYIFLDRDGVIIEDRHYIKDPNDVNLIEGVNDFFDYISSRAFGVIIVTNQSGISRGFFSWDHYEKITHEMLNQINNIDYILGIYANGYSHTVDISKRSDLETWRKPGFGMLKQAICDFDIKIETTILAGDRYTDVLAGIHAGIHKCFHVKTGKGNEERVKVEKLLAKCKSDENENGQIIKIDKLSDMFRFIDEGIPE